MHKTEPKLAAIDERVIGRVRGAVGLDEGHRDSRNLIGSTRRRQGNSGSLPIRWHMGFVQHDKS